MEHPTRPGTSSGKNVLQLRLHKPTLSWNKEQIDSASAVSTCWTHRWRSSTKQVSETCFPLDACMATRSCAPRYFIVITIFNCSTAEKNYPSWRTLESDKHIGATIKNESIAELDRLVSYFLFVTTYGKNTNWRLHWTIQSSADTFFRKMPRLSQILTQMADRSSSTEIQVRVF